MNRTLALLLLLVFTFTAGACGGGGQGEAPVGPPEPLTGSLLAGAYDVYTLGASHLVADHEATVGVGEGIADGVNVLRVSGLANEDGVVTGSTSEMIYEVLPGDVIQFRDPTVSPDPLYRGRITSDGEVALLATITTVDLPTLGLRGVVASPSLIVLVRKGGRFTPGSLDGAFHLNTYGIHRMHTESGVGSATYRPGRSVVIDIDAVKREAYRVDRTPLTVAATYGLSGSGAASLQLGPEELVGGLHASGELLITAGSVVDGHAPRWILQVPKSSGLSDAAFRGTYYMIAFAHSASADVFRGALGTATADGAGGIELRYTANDESVLSDRAYTGRFTVAPDGSLDLETVTEKGMRGGVSPSGRFAIAGGGTRDGDNAAFYFFVRK